MPFQLASAPLPTHASRARKFLARRHTHLLAAGILITWWWVTLRDQLPVLLGILAAAAAAFWITRRRREVAAAILIAAVTSTVPAAAALITVGGNPETLGTAGVLIGYAVAGPIPTMAVWTLRPAMISRTWAAIIGSTVLLTSAAVALAAPPAAATLLPVTVLTVTGTGWLINRRLRAAITDPVHEIPGGWVDLGSRTLPGGQQVHRLLLGRGHGIAAWHTPSSHPGRLAMVAALRRAADLADAIGLPVNRMQPVLIVPSTGTLPSRHLINTGELAGVVILAAPDQVTALTATAPRRARVTGHRAISAAVALPATGRRAAVPA